MRVQLLQAAYLGGKGGKAYSRGVHDMPEKALNDPFFHKLVKAGLAIEVDEARKPVPLQERQKRLAEKLAKLRPQPKGDDASTSPKVVDGGGPPSEPASPVTSDEVSPGMADPKDEVPSEPADESEKQEAEEDDSSEAPAEVEEDSKKSSKRRKKS